VLDRNPWQIPVTDLADVTVLETWFAGEQVYAR
jgi:predicted amidohydrolase YtcJ